MATTYDKASLVMIPSGYKDDKLYSIKPTDGSGDFTFSRDGAGASPATRVNASGYIEKGRSNQLTYSNDFSNAAWIKSSASVTGGQTGYDGSSDAWLFSSTGGYAFISVTTSGVQTYSIYAKQGTLEGIRLRIDAGVDANAYVNLTDGSEYFPHTGIDLNVTSVGGGWWRVSLTADKSIANVRVYGLDNLGSSSTGTIYIQDAQLEQGLVATDYIETTTTAVSAGLLGDMPRLDYSGGATCPSLLLEPSRVNSVDQSEAFIDTSYWSTTSLDVIANDAISPEGLQNASFIRPTTANGGHQIYHTFSMSAGTNTLSLFLKAGNYSKFRLYFYDGSNAYEVYGDCSDGSVYSTNAITDVQDYGNGWYRYSVSATNASFANGNFTLRVVNDSYQDTWAANGTDGLYIYGWQYETGSHPTSYIPTYGSAASRAVEVPVKSSVSSLIGQTEGTLFFDWIMNHESPNTSEDLYSLTLSDGTNNNLIGINNYNNTLVAFIKVTTLQFFDNSYTGGADGARIKLALAYANNDIALYINGTQIATDSSATIPALSEIRLNSYWSGNLVDSTSVNQLVLFKTRLTNAELAALTA